MAPGTPISGAQPKNTDQLSSEMACRVVLEVVSDAAGGAFVPSLCCPIQIHHEESVWEQLREVLAAQVLRT